ncbi:MAG: hypothetical protein KJ622_02575 [Alphaproteobacteria bacterium]|nr:hypothetical protein [Alphaproteobacteria bacterium]
MIRAIVFAAALAFVAAGTFATTADAGHHLTRKLCMAKDRAGQSVKFVCKADELCCYNRLLNEKSCQPKAPRLLIKRCL